MLFNKKDFDSKQRFSIRKLSVGVCSVLLSTLFLTFNEGQTVHASTDVNAADTTTTSVSSNTTNNSSDNNTDKKDDSKVEASSLATAEKHAPIPIAAEIKSNKSEDQTNSASAETATQVSKSKQAQSQTTINIVKATATQASTSSKDSSDTTSSKDNSAQNTVEKNRSTSTSKYTPVLTSETSVSTKTNQSNSNSATQEKSNIKPVTPHADSTEHIAPETYTMDSDTPAYVVAGSDLTNLASKFISNAAALIQSGATFSWVGNAPTATQQDAINGSTISGTIRVTYKDGTSTTKDIESYVEARSQLQPSTFYYVNRVNDTPDFNTADANGNDFSTMIVNQYAYDSTAFSYKILGTLDTSSLGIHWANVQVTDNNTFAGAPLAPTVIGDPYVIKVPYVVQGLKLRDDIPTDDNGNPVINAQLATMPKSTSATPTTPAVAFDPVQGEPSTNNAPAGLWGQYFYQDYALAYALGIKVQVAADEIDSAGHWKNKPTDLVNTKTNHFTVTFNNLSNATQQEVDVNYVSAPHAEDMYIYNAANKTYMTGRPANAQAIKDLLAAGYMNDKVWVTLADGTYYYEVNAKVNIAQKVNFEFVDEYNDNNVVGETYSQEFVPGVETNLKFHMAMPDGYELGNGASIPSQYTLAAFSQTTPVVQVPIHQKMHFYITFHDEDSNTNLGTVEVSGSAAAGTGGYYPSINTKLTFPAGADAGDYYSVSTSGVPDGVQLVGSYGVSLTNPTADWTTPNYQWENTFSVLKALTGATMTINLKHKIQETQEQQTRKPTVNYIKAKVNADGTYTPDGSAFTSAVLDVYYSRTKSKDLVTKKVTYTPWLWDTKQGQNGYHVESGTWTSLPQSWGAVVADVPTLDGYTAATVTDQSGQPANQFVYPTWNKAGTSDEGKESLAYTENAPIYEARPVHTVLYIPNETQTRTVTENYVYADAGDLTGEEVFSPYKLEIFYKKTGSLNVSTNTITYSGWSWDTDAGDSDTPGFHVISGQGNWTGLGSNGQPSGSSLGINVPTKDGYTAIISAYPAAIYSSTVFGNPGVNSGTGYTNDTDSTWYWRNSLTTYYVPNSKLSKTVTRTINITQPGKETETTVQKSTITRTAHLNVNDSGIAYNDWGTDSMYWYALNVPKVGGYTMTVTKTVNGVTTPIQLVNGQIPAETVNGTSQDTTINITWGAVATATLTGTGTSTYNGQAITNAELNNALKVNVTGPTAGAGMYTLQAGDVEFSTDGMNWTTALPINAGNYQVRLTAQGKNGIIAKYGNNSIIWTQNGQSTITSNATYMINKLADNAVMANAQSGNYEMTYNGAAPSTLDPSKFVFTTTVNGQTVTLDATGLNSSDFTWADGNAPVNVGTYKVVLTDAGLAKLNANNPNFDLTNSGNGTFTINQANASATLSGSASREYNGQAVSVDDLNSTSTGNNITLTLHYPKDGNANYSTTVKLNNGYFTWNTPNGQAPVNADSQPYTIVLNSDAIEGIIKQAVGNGQNDVSNVKFADNAISGSASFEITPSANTVSVSGTQTETYNGSPINVVYNADDTNSVKVSITQTSGNTTGAVASLADVTLDSGDFAIVNGPAENVGSYQVKLTAAGLAKIQNAVGDNYHISIDPNAFGTLVIKKYKASAVFSGDPSYTYTGTPVSADDYLGKYSIALNEPNNPTYNLVAGDIEFNVDGNWTSQAPVKVGTYQVRLSQSGWNHIKAINSDNVEWAATASAGKGSYTIDQAKVTADLSGNSSMIYNGSAVSTADLYANGSTIKVAINADSRLAIRWVDANGSTIKVAINGTGIANLPKSFTLEAGDYTWSTSDNQSPVNVGNYTIKLTQAAINKIQSQIDQVVGAGNVVLTTTTDDGGSASFEIKQAVAANVQLYGGENTIYNGNPVSFDPTKTETANNFGFHNVENLTVPTFTASDFTWYDGQGNKLSSAPTNAGTYYLKLNTQGEKAFADANPNYTFEENGKSTISGEIPYVVTPAELTIGVSGSASKVFNDKNAEITQEQINNGDIKLVWGNSTTEPTDLGKFTLTPSDLEVVDANGKHAIHANAGIGADGQPVKGNPYKVQLTADAIKRIKQLSGAANYKISQSAKSGEYFIYEHKAELTLTGNQTTVYGTATPFSPSKYQLAFTNWLSTDLPVPNLTWKDNKLLNNDNDTGLTWTVGDLYVEGYPDGGVPTNVGTYRVKISKQLTDKLRQLFPDYDFSGNIGENGVDEQDNEEIVEPSHTPASYVITPANTTVKITGAQHVKYGESTNINVGDYSISITAPVHNETVDNNAERIYTNVTLAAGDLEFVTVPTNVGTYQVKLSAQGLQKLKDLAGSSNYDWTQAADAKANFFVEQMPVTIAVSGQSSVTYGTQDWLNAIKVNPSGYVLTITTENGAALSYHTVDGDLVFNQTPGNVGEYQVELSAQGLANIEEKLGTNYSYPQTAADVTAKGTFTVKQGEVTVTLNGSDGKTYNAVPTLSSGLNLDKYNVAYTTTVYSADGKAQTLTLTANDLQIIGDATNVGTYQVELSEAGQEKLKALTGNQGANYKWAFNTNADYVVKAAAASAELSGSNQKTFDGTAVTTAEVNSNGQILVHFTFPGSTTQSTYALQNGDYTWSTANGNAPTNVGTYTISLNKQAILDHLQNALNTQAGLGDNDQSNVTVSADKLSGQASFKINPQTLTDVTISAPDQSKTYDAQAADLDVNGITITANGIVANNPLVNPGISASDFTWYDETGNKLESAPVDVGTYQARLNASTLAELQNANSNYQFSSVAGLINYTINPAPATAKISGSADRDYNAQTTSVSDVMNKIKWNTTGLVTNQDLNLTGLTANSYAWYSKDADGNYVAMTGNPVNAGTYYLRLTKDAIAQVKADNSNYNFTSVDGEFTYTINVVNGTATLRGSSSKTYDGQAATTAEVNSTNGDIIVSFAFPGSSAQSTYALQAGDYIWENKDGQEISAPTNAGTYTIKLSADGITNLQNAINQYAGQGNVTLDAQDLLGAAVYTIKQKALNVILGNNGTGTDGKTYDGQPAVINTQAENFGVFTTSGLVNGEDLNAANLTNDDYEWVDANGKAISAPTNAGTYYISLTANGLKKLQADNPNYAISESGQFTYVIRPAEENVTISGSQESTSTSIDNANFTVHAPAGITVPTGMTYEFATGVPSESGVYVIKLTPESIAALEKTNPNYKLNISSDARFTLDATLSIEFEDTQDGNKQVGKTITKTGVANSTINDLKLVVPDNYELAPDQELPTSYTFGKTLNQNLYIKLVHKLNELNPTDPSTNPHPTNKNWFRENGLVKDVTRTINYEGLSTAQLAQIPETQKAQTVEFTRTAKYDLVTGKIVVNSEGSWTAVDGKDIFAGFTPFAFAGYTAAPAKVEQVKVTGNDKNSQITVTYTANNQTGKISYVDSDGKEVGQTTISGKTGETVKVTPEAPTGWQIVSGQDIPETVVATPTGVPTVVVKVTHSTITVTPETPEKDIPTGPVPGDPSKNYEKMESLTATPTRTIVVTDPSGKTTKVTQTVNFTRTATFDEVTGRVTYSDWKLQNSNASNHAAQWDSYTPHVITHYVPSVAEVPAKVVNSHTANSQVEITYAPASESQVIRYVDQNGKEISTQIVSGKYGLDTTFTPKLPNNWQAANTIPTSIKIGENGGLTTIVIEAKTEKVQQSKTVTETIHYHTANGKQIVADKEMKVNFTRTGVKNLVTGEITWNSWNNAEEIFNEVPSPKVSGYTASPAKVAAQTVTPNSEDLVFNVIYTKNSQTYPTIPENKPNKPQEENVSKQETKTQDKLIHEYGYKKRADGRLVDHTGHVYPASSKVKENGAIYSEKGELLSVGSRRKHELPQTGLHDNSLIAAIGSLLAGISIFGLLGGRKKKDDDK
ncbi:MBG domain-containing protein [Lactobacillus gasseri]|uniref:MBG domain-containing protein n=1 Tax=Lactobacillus gasseri TaxID=1596 RepID=UPI004044E467